jgi:hypothetical protein
MAVAVGLLLVFVVVAVEIAAQVILVIAPGDAGHQVDAVAVIAPGLDALRQGGIESIDNGDIRAQIAVGLPRRVGLEASAFQVLLRV